MSKAPPAVDASMTLLIETMRRPLDPGYAAAALRRAEQGADHESRRAPLTLVLAAVGGLVLLTAVVALRLPGTADGGERLREQVRDRTAAVDAAQARVASLTSEIDRLRDAQLSDVPGSLVDQARVLGVLAGTEAVSGPGIVYVLDDAVVADDPVSAAQPGDDALDGRVVARDLQVVVNGLWGAGAEAVSVNGHRLTATAAIRQAGDAVIVDFRPLAPPYEVEAIGNPASLQTRFAGSLAGAYVNQVEQNYGVRVSVSAADEIGLAAGGNLLLRHARPPAPTQQGGGIP